MMMLRLVDYASWYIQTGLVYILDIDIRHIRLRNLKKKKDSKEMKVIQDMKNKKYNQCCQAPSIYGILISYVTNHPESHDK